LLQKLRVVHVVGIATLERHPLHRGVMRAELVELARTVPPEAVLRVLVEDDLPVLAVRNALVSPSHFGTDLDEFLLELEELGVGPEVLFAAELRDLCLDEAVNDDASNPGLEDL